MKREVWYLCAPEKNRACGKTRCYRYGGDCMMTSNREAAVKAGNGRAILMIIRKTGGGFRREIRLEEDGVTVRRDRAKRTKA